MMRLGLYKNFILADRHRLGRWGEKYCIKHLRKKGFKLVAHNYDCPGGEIDLIFFDPSASVNTLVFVEVKTRISGKLFHGRPLVRYRQKKRIAAAGKYFRKIYNIKDKPVRFDIVTIILPRIGQVEIDHKTNAFIP